MFHRNGFIRTILFFVAGLVVIHVIGAPRPAEAASSATLTLGTTVVGEGDDFATRVLALPWWNMNGEPYPDTFTAVKNINYDTFHVTPDGFWDMKATNTDPRIWLHFTGVGTTQRVLKMGDSYPIDANKYKLLSYYMCLDKAPSPLPFQDDEWSSLVYWMYDRTPHDDPANGFSNFLLFKHQGRFKNDGDCELLTFDLSHPAAWQESAWDNTPTKPIGLRLDPINVTGARFQIGWVRLTTKDTSNVVPITWSNAPSGTNQFFVSLSGCGQDGILIGSKAGVSGTLSWGSTVISGFSAAHPLPLPESFEPGTYHVYMKDANGAVACAGNNPLKVHAAPIFEFQKPSFLSGPDFATVVVDDPWGMVNSEDIEQFVNVDEAIFADSILSIVAEDSDPRMFLNVDGNTIPSSQYRYVTFRFKINGTNSLASGWVQRWVWWYQGGPGVDNVTTQDLQIYENWHTYTIDLKTAPTENCPSNCWSGNPRVLRFDPFETPKPTAIEMDYVLLTGDERVDRGTLFPIYFTTTAAPNATITFYYDTDTNPTNGRTLIGHTALSAGPEQREFDFLALKAFLPILWSTDLSEIPLYSSSTQFNWLTAGVPFGTYYISAVINDGVMVTTWYSEMPVIVE